MWPIEERLKNFDASLTVIIFRDEAILLPDVFAVIVEFFRRRAELRRTILRNDACVLRGQDDARSLPRKNAVDPDEGACADANVGAPLFVVFPFRVVDDVMKKCRDLRERLVESRTTADSR